MSSTGYRAICSLAFLHSRNAFRADLEAGSFRAALRVKRVVGHPGIWELTFAPDGRATFHYGAEAIPGQPHIVWRRIGSHEVFDDP